MTTENQYSPKVIGERKWPALEQEWPGQIEDLAREDFAHVKVVDTDPAVEHRHKSVAMVIAYADAGSQTLSTLRSWLHSISDERRDSWLDEAVRRLDELAGHYEQEYRG